MSYWVKQSEDQNLPSYLREGIESNCGICGFPKMNYYNDANRCTARRCSNDKCPGLLAAKAEWCCKYLNITGVGYGKCLSLIQDLNLTNHIECLSRVIDGKLSIDLAQYLRIHCFKDIDTAWESVVLNSNAYTLDELFEKYSGQYKDFLVMNKEVLYDNLKYVDLQVPNRDHQVVDNPYGIVSIMITGIPNGFATKDAFVAFCNYICKGLIRVDHIPNKRVTGVDYLIREPGSATRGKYEAAIKGGIPIVTSEEFINELPNLIEFYMKRRS